MLLDPRRVLVDVALEAVPVALAELAVLRVEQLQLQQPLFLLLTNHATRQTVLHLQHCCLRRCSLPGRQPTARALQFPQQRRNGPSPPCNVI